MAVFSGFFHYFFSSLSCFLSQSVSHSVTLSLSLSHSLSDTLSAQLTLPYTRTVILTHSSGNTPITPKKYIIFNFLRTQNYRLQNEKKKKKVLCSSLSYSLKAMDIYIYISRLHTSKK